MRRVLATDLGIWFMLQRLERASDAMLASPKYWATLANYLLQYDQVIIPTGNFQIIPVLRLMLGEAVFDELVKSRVLAFLRYDTWFGYIGRGGVTTLSFGDGPAPRPRPNIASSYFKPLDQAVDDILTVGLPRSSAARHLELHRLIVESTTPIPTEVLFGDIRKEAYADVLGSPYLRSFLALRNRGRTIDNLVGSRPNKVVVYSPHVPPEPRDSLEIRAVLQVVFENLLLRLGAYSQATDITGDAATLTVLNAKGQRLGFAPDGERAFAAIQSVSGVPDLGRAFADRLLTPSALLLLRQSPHAEHLRKWLALGAPADSAAETVARYVETIGQPSLIEQLPAKLLRFGTTTTWGALEPVTGTVAGAIDAFLLSKWFPSRSPRLFMRQAKAVLAEAQTVPAPKVTPGRNAPCACGSGKKFKHCCARLA